MARAEDARAAYQAEKDALDALLALDPPQRDAAFEALAARDPALAAVVGRRLTLSQLPAPSTAPRDLPPRIARYTVHEEIGRGGMGRVWRATRADAADQQQLAIKQVRAEFRDTGALHRFEAERRILSRLDHPHIVPLLDAGTDLDGQPFLVTPLIDGEPIDTRCDQRALDVAARIRLVRDVVEALAHAHRQLIVHRDLKPANVLVDAGGRVRLLDFGIAKMLDADHDPTAAGHSLMTLRYAAPEQVRGGTLGIGVDLYAVGVLLYELLAGTHPYPAAQDPAALVHAIAHDDPAPLPPRDARGQRLPRDLAAVVARLLRKRPEDRYPSAEALLDELDRWLRGEPVQALAHQRSYRARRWLRRRWPWVAGVVVALALGGLHLQRIESQLVATQRERDKAAAVADHFVSLFRTATPNAARSGDVSARELLSRSSRALLDEPVSATVPEARAALLLALARVHQDLGLSADAVTLSEAAVAQLRSRADPLALADALRESAAAHYALNHVEAYRALTAEALETLERAGETDGVLYARLLGNAGFARFLAGDAAAAWALLDRGRALLAARRPETRAEYVRALVNAGGLAQVAGDNERAHALLLEAQAEFALLRERNPDQQYFIARNLAAVERDSGRVEAARVRYAELRPAAESFYGAGHRELVSVLVGESETALAQGRLHDALRGLDEAERHGRLSLAPEHDHFTDIAGLRAVAQLLRGELEPARVALEDNVQRRGDRLILEAQPRLEAVALARTRCEATDKDELVAAIALLGAGTNVPRWQAALATRWQAECAKANSH